MVTIQEIIKGMGEIIITEEVITGIIVTIGIEVDHMKVEIGETIEV